MSVEAPPIYMRYNSIDINNSQSVDLEVLVDELRPSDPYLSRDALFLSVPFDHDEPITGQWTATAKDYHEMLSGELQLELEDPVDLTEGLRSFLHRSDDDDEDAYESDHC